MNTNWPAFLCASLVFFADTADEPKKTAWMWWDDIETDQLMGRLVKVDSKKDIQFAPKQAFGIMMSLTRRSTKTDQ